MTQLNMPLRDSLSTILQCERPKHSACRFGFLNPLQVVEHRSHRDGRHCQETCRCRRRRAGPRDRRRSGCRRDRTERFRDVSRASTGNCSQRTVPTCPRRTVTNCSSISMACWRMEPTLARSRNRPLKTRLTSPTTVTASSVRLASQSTRFQSSRSRYTTL